jgi:uncharacterized protein (TIGR03435 family)
MYNQTDATDYGCIVYYLLAGAQAPIQSVANDRQIFDTATVKQDLSNAGRGTPVINAQSLLWRGATLKRMICEAYQVQSTQVLGAPEWTDTERFEVIARVDKPATIDQIRLMLQSLLADRFRLSVRRQTKNLDVLALSVVRGGPKISPIPPDQRDQPDPTVSLNAFHRRASMSQLASLLSQMLSGPVFNPTTGRLEPREDQSGMIIDQTGLNGIYDINLNLNLSPDLDLRSGIEGALSALGLRLQSKRLPVETIFVVAVERVPIGN